MSAQLEQLRHELLALPVEMRASLATTLIESLDESADVDAESVWMEEIRRRDAEIRSGKAVLKPLDQVVREVRDLLKSAK